MSTTTRSYTEADALKWFADVLGAPVDTITPATGREELPMWDSLGTLLLLAAFDETFGIVMSDAEMAGIATVGDVVAVLRAHGKVA
jgi:acyl carrier protein